MHNSGLATSKPTFRKAFAIALATFLAFSLSIPSIASATSSRQQKHRIRMLKKSPKIRVIRKKPTVYRAQAAA